MLNNIISQILKKTGSDDDSDDDSYKDIESENEGDSDSEKPTVSQPKKSTLDLKVNYFCHCCIFWICHYGILLCICCEWNIVDFTLNLVAGKEESHGWGTEGASLHFPRFLFCAKC